MPDLDVKDIIEIVGSFDYEILVDFLWQLSEKISSDEEKEDVGNLINELIAKQKERDKEPYVFLK